MFFTVPHYEVIDATKEAEYTVIAETDKRSEGDEYIADKRLFESCWVSKDADAELYRVVCKVMEARSNVK